MLVGHIDLNVAGFAAVVVGIDIADLRLAAGSSNWYRARSCPIARRAYLQSGRIDTAGFVVARLGCIRVSAANAPLTAAAASRRRVVAGCAAANGLTA